MVYDAVSQNLKIRDLKSRYPKIRDPELCDLADTCGQRSRGPECRLVGFASLPDAEPEGSVKPGKAF